LSNVAAFWLSAAFTLTPGRFDLRVDENSIRWAGTIVPPGAVHLSVNSANPAQGMAARTYAAMLRRGLATPAGRAGGRFRRCQGTGTCAAATITSAVVNDPRLQLLLENMSIAQLAGVLKRCPPARRAGFGRRAIWQWRLECRRCRFSASKRN